MIVFKRIEFSNCFSYGDDNYVDFIENPLTQLTGSNGAGKTSIALLIQEVLYGKNTKNIKKQDIVNNKSDKPGYTIKLWFDKDDNEYLVHLDRKSQLKLKLFENGTDISSHSSLNTYKNISDILGIPDFKVFCQLIYQHSTDSLDFLTATDTNRKKFLINLLQLDKYVELHELFKSKVQEAGKELSAIQGSINTIEEWILRNKNFNFNKIDTISIPSIPNELLVEESELITKIDNINILNKRIAANNEYLEQLHAIDLKYITGSAPADPNPSSSDIHVSIGKLTNEHESLSKRYKKLNSAEGTCPSCLQEVDKELRNKMLRETEENILIVQTNITSLKNALLETQKLEKEISKYNFYKQEFERYSQLINKDLPKKSYDINELKQELKVVQTKLDNIRKDIKLAETHNSKANIHNSKIDIIRGELNTMENELKAKNITLTEKEILLDILELLKKTFSTNGLISYKIESSIKELEKEINHYLSELTYFQIYFKLNGEKLNIEVLDDTGNITNVTNLSSGEKARVNIATILAIRKILSSLTSTRLNLLFLDEVIGVIDTEGKEKLAEILLEENLNTFIVSHDWSHPLIPKLSIIKENNISRIERN